MDPSEHERESDGHRGNASPEKTKVHPPAQGRSLRDERLCYHVRRHGTADNPDGTPESESLDQFHASLPESLRRRFLEPDGIVISDTPVANTTAKV